MGRPDPAAWAAIAQRRADAIDLKLMRLDWLTIGRKLAAAPAFNSDGVAYPQGYSIEKYRKGLEPPTDKRLIELARHHCSACCTPARISSRVERTAAMGDCPSPSPLAAVPSVPHYVWGVRHA